MLETVTTTADEMVSTRTIPPIVVRLLHEFTVRHDNQMATHIQLKMTQKRRKASECRELVEFACPIQRLIVFTRISPRHSPGPSLPPSSHVSPQPPPTPTDPPRQSEMDLDLPLSPPPVESRLAARRAKRLAIIAKYAGIASSPSLGPSSAVQPPQPISSISDPISQAYSVADTAGIIQEIDMTLTS